MRAVDAGVRLASTQRQRGAARASALLVAGSYCASAATGAIAGCLITGHPPSDAFTWLGQGSVAAGGAILAGAAFVLHWPFKWAIDHWW